MTSKNEFGWFGNVSFSRGNDGWVEPVELARGTMSNRIIIVSGGLVSASGAVLRYLADKKKN